MHHFLNEMILEAVEDAILPGIAAAVDTAINEITDQTSFGIQRAFSNFVVDVLAAGTVIIIEWLRIGGNIFKGAVDLTTTGNRPDGVRVIIANGHEIDQITGLDTQAIQLLTFNDPGGNLSNLTKTMMGVYHPIPFIKPEIFVIHQPTFQLNHSIETKSATLNTEGTKIITTGRQPP